MRFKTQFIILLIFISGLMLFYSMSCRKETIESVVREFVQDRKVCVRDSVIWEIPDVFRWCDRLDMKKRRIDIGECELYVEEEGRGTPLVLLSGTRSWAHHCMR